MARRWLLTLEVGNGWAMEIRAIIALLTASMMVTFASELSAANAQTRAGYANQMRFVKAPAAKKQMAANWHYSDTPDKMRGTTTHYAAVTSKNALTFSFPYHGGRASLNLRTGPTHGLEIYVSISGQFECGDNDDIHVKFDDGPIEEFECVRADAGVTDTIFIENGGGWKPFPNKADDFIVSLKAAKTVTIEANFYREGTRQMEFNVAGLKWSN